MRTATQACFIPFRLGSVVLCLSFVLAGCARADQPTSSTPPLCISGVYPHLTAFNANMNDAAHPNWKEKPGEVGIGAVVPWAGKLWMITYSPHEPKGSPDKLYAIDENLKQEIRPESVGGTPAGRMIHRESNQLIIGPYFIDEKGDVRVIPPSVMPGRLTAIARHLTDPANKVYFFDMEGAVYEADVHTLAVSKLFSKPVPGWHGKGGYTAQGRFIIANNGEADHGKLDLKVKDLPKNSENAGVLAEWDGKEWRIIERRQFTDVTGPGGILGSPDDKSPAWAIGWDRRSVLLKLLDNNQWHTFRLPKASHAYDAKHGWFTEWPRIRQVADNTLLMDMHGMFYNFPITFSAANTAGIAPISSHLRYIPDFCSWNGRLVLATDETTIMANPMAGQAESNLWFGTLADLGGFGPASAWGGPWVNDPVQANTPSTPFLINGFARRIVHLAHQATSAVTFTLEIDARGDGKWTTLEKIEVPADGYRFRILPDSLQAQWIRVTADKECTATAYFHFSAAARAVPSKNIFAALAAPADTNVSAALIRPAGHNRNLQGLTLGGTPGYFELDQTLAVSKPESRADEVGKICKITKDFQVDDASVILIQKDKRYRLPKGDSRFDQPFANGWPRGVRECESERTMANIHGTFYEIGRDSGIPKLRPICTHNRQIVDYCTWRGLLVISGTRADAFADGNYFPSTGLWFGAIDDLWQLGKPVGTGGPWKNTTVTPGTPSDPYLMTNYDRKKVALSHDASSPVAFTIEVDVDHAGWHEYQTIQVPPGQTITHEFPAGFAAHWVRVKSSAACRATAWFTYE